VYGQSVLLLSVFSIQLVNLLLHGLQNKEPN